MLRIEGLRKTFPVDKGQVRAVQDVNIDIAEGQFFTLLGPSGSGKSTTLRCVAGLEHPEDGEIFIGGDCVFSAKRRILLRPKNARLAWSFNRMRSGRIWMSFTMWPFPCCTVPGAKDIPKPTSKRT